MVKANRQIWPECRGHTPTLFHPGILNDHRETGPQFDVSSEGWCFSHHYTGALGPTHTTWEAPPAGLTSTSPSSNLVFLRGLPSRYWPLSTLLSFSGQTVLGYRVIYLLANTYLLQHVFLGRSISPPFHDSPLLLKINDLLTSHVPVSNV